MCGTIFRYLGNHFIINFNKIADKHYVWISVIGEAELAKDFLVKMTLGKGQTITISQCGKVFPITMRWEDIFKESDGVLAFGNVGNGQDAFFKEEGGRTSFSIFVKFLRPVIKEEEGCNESEPVPSTSRNWRELKALKIKTEVEDNEPTSTAAVASTSMKASQIGDILVTVARAHLIDDGSKSKGGPKQKQKNKPGPKCSKKSTLPATAGTQFNRKKFGLSYVLKKGLRFNFGSVTWDK